MCKIHRQHPFREQSSHLVGTFLGKYILHFSILKN
eukprot:UN00926